jgi:hypothetical protein
MSAEASQFGSSPLFFQVDVTADAKRKKFSNRKSPLSSASAEIWERGLFNPTGAIIRFLLFWFNFFTFSLSTHTHTHRHTHADTHTHAIIFLSLSSGVCMTDVLTGQMCARLLDRERGGWRGGVKGETRGQTVFIHWSTGSEGRSLRVKVEL